MPNSSWCGDASLLSRSYRMPTHYPFPPMRLVMSEVTSVVPPTFVEHLRNYRSGKKASSMESDDVALRLALDVMVATDDVMDAERRLAQDAPLPCASDAGEQSENLHTQPGAKRADASPTALAANKQRPTEPAPGPTRSMGMEAAQAQQNFLDSSSG